MELTPLYIEMLNILKSSADGMTKHEVDKRIGKILVVGYFNTLIKHGYIEIVGTKDGYKQIVYPDGDILDIAVLSFPVYKIVDGKW